MSAYFQLNQKEKEREKYTDKEIIIIDSFFKMGLLVSFVLAGPFKETDSNYKGSCSF